MTKKEIHYLNGTSEIVDYTAEEEAKNQAVHAKHKEIEYKAIADKEAKDNLKASAKAKLIAGEALTAEEADTIVL